MRSLHKKKNLDCIKCDFINMINSFSRNEMTESSYLFIGKHPKIF